MASNSKVTATHAACEGRKAIDCKSQGKGKDSTRRYHGNRGKGLSIGGTKGFTKGKGKGMNNCKQGQRRWPATPSFHDLLSLEQMTESVHNVQEKMQHSHVNESTETRATSDPHQHWKVPVKWIQTRTNNNKKKLQVRNRFEALRTDDEEFPIIDEYDDPGLPEAVAKKQHQGGMQRQTCKHRSATTRINARDEGNETDLCPLESTFPHLIFTNIIRYTNGYGKLRISSRTTSTTLSTLRTIA